MIWINRHPLKLRIAFLFRSKLRVSRSGSLRFRHGGPHKNECNRRDRS
jgi:hypothetical protein